ncbi:MAG: TPM domain-containing protein [Massilia sp.]
MAGFTQQLGRQWRHWCSTSARARHLFPVDTLARIGDAITAGEQLHRGELRLIVEKAWPSAAIWSGLSNRQRAIALFAQYGVWDTEDNCGVLIYVNLADRKVDIVVDRAIGRKIDAATWQQVCATLTTGFAKGDYHEATLAAVNQVSALLAAHFPSTGPRPNELPDAPIVL